MSTQPAKPQMSSSERARGWSGPAILSYGYRSFFMAAGVWAVFAMLYWIVILSNEAAYWSLFYPLDWHAHEMLFGYLGAVLAGFLLTAVPNWTGRLPIVGWPVAALFALWLLGRVAIGLSQFLSAGVAGLLDLLLPLALAQHPTLGALFAVWGRKSGVSYRGRFRRCRRRGHWVSSWVGCGGHVAQLGRRADHP